MWANEKEINLLVIDSGKDDEQAWAKCRAVIAKTGQFVESRVVLRYKDVEERLMITQVKKILKEAPRGATETPVLKSLKEPLLINEEGRIMANYKPYGLMEFMKKMSNYRYTAERTAETMAARRAQWKILNKEWKDEFERKSEEEIDEYEQGESNTEEKQEAIENEELRKEERETIS